MRAQSRWFLPLMAATGVTMSLTAPLEVLFAREISPSSVYIGAFMLSAAIGVIAVDVFGTRFVPSLDARTALIAGLALFGLACIGMGLAPNGILMMASRILQGLGGGMVLGAGLQAAVRIVRPGATLPPITSAPSDDLARSLGRFNAAFLFGGAVGAPGGLLVAGIIEGQIGYQIALVATGTLALTVAGTLAMALPSMTTASGMPPPRIGLPRFARIPGSRPAIVLAMSGEFLRAGVLFTALPLAGAARGYSTLMITAAIALMCGTEIIVLANAHRVIARFGVFSLLIMAFALGVTCAMLIAAVPSPLVYLLVSAVFGVSLAGATVGLPVVIVAQVGESSAGLAKFRVSAGIGQLAGMVGCAVLGAQVGVATLFVLIAFVLLASTQLARIVAHRMAAT